MSTLGKKRRLSRIFNLVNKRTVIIPLDDVLLSGPEGGLKDVSKKIKQIIHGRPNAIVGFKGLFLHNLNEILNSGCIMNLTASTIRRTHTRKTLVSSVEEALMLDMDAVAVHVNLSSQYETEMLKILGEVSKECSKYGMPLMAMMYPRSEINGKDNNYYDLFDSDPKAYSEIVRHAARVGVDLGADIIKTQYTGSAESFSTVVESCGDVPIVIAGGPLKDVNQLMDNVFNVMRSGAAGVCFGRNVFNRTNSDRYVEALVGIVHNNWTSDQAVQYLSQCCTGN